MATEVEKLILKNQKFILRYLLSIKKHIGDVSLADRILKENNRISVDGSQLSLDGDYTSDLDNINELITEIDKIIK